MLSRSFLAFISGFRDNTYTAPNKQNGKSSKEITTKEVLIHLWVKHCEMLYAYFYTIYKLKLLIPDHITYTKTNTKFVMYC